MKDLKVLHLETWRQEFPENICNYDKVQEYLDFIVEAAERYDPERYSEWHHIFPKCLDKEGKYHDEGARINGADHFTAHVLLVDCFYRVELKRNLQYAVLLMIPQEMSYRECSPEVYEEARKRYSELQSVALAGKSNPFYGKHHTDETKSKISLTKSSPTDEARKNISTSQVRRFAEKPESHGMYGKRHTDESKRRMSESHRNMSNGTREKMRQSAKGNTSHKGHYHTEETKYLISQKKLSSVPPNKGKVGINNGTVNRYILRTDPLPEGWSYGSIRRKKVVQ